jgi:hypothetical protein
MKNRIKPLAILLLGAAIIFYTLYSHDRSIDVWPDVLYEWVRGVILFGVGTALIVTTFLNIEKLNS